MCPGRPVAGERERDTGVVADQALDGLAPVEEPPHLANTHPRHGDRDNRLGRVPPAGPRGQTGQGRPGSTSGGGTPGERASRARGAGRGRPPTGSGRRRPRRATGRRRRSAAAAAGPATRSGAPRRISARHSAWSSPGRGAGRRACEGPRRHRARQLRQVEGVTVTRVLHLVVEAHHPGAPDPQLVVGAEHAVGSPYRRKVSWSGTRAAKSRPPSCTTTYAPSCPNRLGATPGQPAVVGDRGAGRPGRCRTRAGTRRGRSAAPRRGAPGRVAAAEHVAARRPERPQPGGARPARRPGRGSRGPGCPSRARRRAGASGGTAAPPGGRTSARSAHLPARTAVTIPSTPPCARRPCARRSRGPWVQPGGVEPGAVEDGHRREQTGARLGLRRAVRRAAPPRPKASRHPPWRSGSSGRAARSGRPRGRRRRPAARTSGTRGPAGGAPSGPWADGATRSRTLHNREREELLAGGADLDLGVHLRADAAVVAGRPAAVLDLDIGVRVDGVFPVGPEPVLVEAGVEVVPGQDLVVLALAGGEPVEVDVGAGEAVSADSIQRS